VVTKLPPPDFKIPTYGISNCGGQLDIQSYEIFIRTRAPYSYFMDFRFEIKTS
ncbi:20290_t:CDS:1, partial [Gigaspora rosea]